MILDLFFYHQRRQIHSQPLGPRGISTSSVIIFGLQKLNSLGFICPRTRSTLERHLNSADQSQQESILLKQWRTHKRSLQWGSGMVCTTAIQSVQSDTLQVGARSQIKLSSLTWNEFGLEEKEGSDQILRGKHSQDFYICPVQDGLSLCQAGNSKCLPPKVFSIPASATGGETAARKGLWRSRIFRTEWGRSGPGHGWQDGWQPSGNLHARWENVTCCPWAYTKPISGN